MQQIKPLSEYGPLVWCDDAQQETHTQRPYKSTDPWFCFYCGRTDHKETA